MLYDDNFYKIIKESSRVSSERIVPLVKTILNKEITSVVDFGCPTCQPAPIHFDLGIT